LAKHPWTPIQILSCQTYIFRLSLFQKQIAYCIFIYFVPMKSFLKISGAFFLCSSLLLSCAKKTSRQIVEKNLESAMEQSLNHTPGIDTSLLKFKVLSVFYFEDKNYYDCEFKVSMSQKKSGVLSDTTGVMKASISKDFQNVKRLD
jgi:hypothetical protein